MRLGSELAQRQLGPLQGITLGPESSISQARGEAAAVEAEARGFESLWFPEHSHIPASRKSPWPGGAELPKWYYDTYDPFVAMGAAAVTAGVQIAKAGDTATAVLARLGIADAALKAMQVFRRGYDARKPQAIMLVYTLDVEVADEAALLARHAGDQRIGPAPDTGYRDDRP